MGLVAKLVQALRPKEPEPVWKYIGHCRFRTNLTGEDGNVAETIEHMAFFYMTENNQRRVEYASAESNTSYRIDTAMMSRRHPYRLEISKWLAGGSFPHTFEAESDVLGEMLTRLVSQKLEDAA